MAAVLALHRVDARLAEALAEVDAVPVGDAAGPVGGGSMDLVGHVVQPGLAGAVVEPVDAFEVVPTAELRPVAPQETLLRVLELLLEVAGHEWQDPVVL